MKRKRVAKEKILKAAARKFPTVERNQEEFLNYANYVREENYGSDESDDSSEEYDSKSESETSSFSSSSMETDGSSGNEDTDSEDVGMVEKTKISSKKAMKLKVNKKTKYLVNGHGKPKSKKLGSSSRKWQKSRTRYQEPRYCKKELRVALAVIKKVMKMEEAKPFCVPVDPIALGMPDYFDAIDTPIDFSTICSNLQSGIKYMNAADVFKDVQLIWENCYKFNKKGECILILMKRVEKKFMKYWAAAGLYSEQKWKIKESSPMLLPRDSHVTCSRQEPRGQLSSMISSPSPMQLDDSGHSQLQLQFPTSCYSQPYKSQTPQPSSSQPWSRQFHADCVNTGHPYMPRNPMGHEVDSSSQFQMLQPQLNHNQPYYLQRPQKNTSQVHHLQSLAATDIDPSGCSHLQANTESPLKHFKYVPQNASNSIISTPTKTQSQCPEMSYVQQNSLHQSKQSPRELQPSHLQAGADIVGAKHLHLQPPTNHTMRHNESVPRCPVDPMVSKPGQFQPQQPMLSGGQLNELLEHKASFGHLQQSQTQNREDIDCADPPVGRSSSTQRHLEDHVIDSPNKQQQVQDGPSYQQPKPRQLSESLYQQYESWRLSQKKGKRRGPAKCQFLKDVREGERIKVTINSHGEPIGPESTKLSSFLGIIARNGFIAPLIFVSWKYMPDEAKEEMWECVQSMFDIDPRCKTWILNSIADKWRNWKAELKENHYYPHQSDEDRLKDLDPRVVPDQWPVLISYWNSEKEQMRSAKNKANRAKHKSNHTSGRKSYARLREEERMKRPNGEEPTPAELYILTHTRKNGKLVNEEAAAKILQLQDEAKQQKSSEGNDDHCNQDVGKERSGRMDSYVRVASKTKGSNNNELSKMLVKIEAMEEKYAHMETLVNRMISVMRRFLEERPLSSATLKTSITKQVPGTSNGPGNSPQTQSHSLSSCYAVPSNEAACK